MKKIPESLQNIKKEIRRQILSYMTAAFGIVAGFAWNEAIKSLIEYFIPPSSNAVWAKLIYAAVLTVVVVFATIVITRVFAKRDEEANK